MSKRYFLIPANYLAFDFNKLFDLEGRDDSGKKGHVLWALNSNDAKMDVGDVCYLYYSNLPDKTSRIILRGIVSASDSYNDDPDTYLEPGQKCVELTDLKTINWKNAGKMTFTYDDLKAYGVNITRNKRALKDDRAGDKELREALEAYYEKDNNKLNLDELRDDIVKKLQCAFDSGTGNLHKSFIQANGLRYFETHHFIQQNVCRNTDDRDLIDAVYDEKNLIYLCPMCHRRIHYGRKEDIRNMIDKIYQKNEKFYGDKFIKYAKLNGENTVKDWLYDMYKVKEV